MTQICNINQGIVGSNNGLSPDLHQAIIYTNAVSLSTGPLGTNLSQIGFKTFSFNKMPLNMSTVRWQQVYFCLNMLSHTRQTFTLLINESHSVDPWNISTFPNPHCLIMKFCRVISMKANPWWPKRDLSISKRLETAGNGMGPAQAIQGLPSTLQGPLY